MRSQTQTRPGRWQVSQGSEVEACTPRERRTWLASAHSLCVGILDYGRHTVAGGTKTERTSPQRHGR
jgi:hypothetical protein